MRAAILTRDTSGHSHLHAVVFFRPFFRWTGRAQFCTLAGSDIECLTPSRALWVKRGNMRKKKAVCIKSVVRLQV